MTMKKSSSLPGRTPSRLRCMKLEQRILFDGAAAAEVVAADAAASVPLDSALPAEMHAPAPLVEAPTLESAAPVDTAVVAEPTVAPGEAAAAQESLVEPVADSAADAAGVMRCARSSSGWPAACRPRAAATR